MAKVALRIYNHEIENLITQGNIDEAIAHCRHILKTFPKHLETYRLLGKAYLEARRYNEAIDIFGRLLMAVPDDFVAHVGLSIIRDEENKLDDSIWHMERAFESQPSNAAIQSELQRLYGRRDGIEPPKVRMTRGALARMYVTGELYPQAIAEIRGLLAEDSQRADMQMLLALAYFRSGQKSDSTDLCNQLLKRYPYSFDANRIMVELLPATTGTIESTQVYRMRVSEMDPYSNFSKGGIFHSDEASDASINLERLDYKPGDEVQMGQDWGSSLGIEFGSSSVAALSSSNIDEQPEWLKSVGFGGDEPPLISPASGETPQDFFGASSESQTTDEIPDFLRAAGWGESQNPEQPTSMFDDDNLEPVAADLPDWLKNQAPVKEAPSQPASHDDVIETPDWLSGLASSDPLEVLQNETNESAQKNETPDWLSELGGAQPMSNSDANDDDAIQPANIPDWLQGAQPKQEPSSNVESLGASSQEQDDAVAWLESLAAKHGAKPEELVTDPNKRSETPPDWVAQAQTIGSQPQQPSANVESLGASSQEQDDAVAWLESLAAKHGAKPEELVTDPNKRSETPPDWVAQAQTIGNQPAKEEPVENALNIGEQFFAEFEQGTSSEQPATDETGMWLRDLESKQEPDQPVANVPDWLSDIDNQPEQKEQTEKLMGNQNLSDWLSGLDNEPGLELDPEILRSSQRAPFQSPSVEETSTKKDVPDWLSSLEDEKESDSDSWQPPAASTIDLQPDPVPSSESLPDWLAENESADADSINDDDLLHLIGSLLSQNNLLKPRDNFLRIFLHQARCCLKRKSRLQKGKPNLKRLKQVPVLGC
jgi:tetratricopeptide (TPR) repeat protein